MIEKMSDEIVVTEELGRGKAYRIKMGDTNIVALKLEGFRAQNIGGAVSTMGIGVEGERVESNDWLILVKDSEGVYTDDVWKKKVANGIANVSGTYVDNITISNVQSE
ncbi:MAG: hypothetical protein JW878_11130 [Methanomicrobia archaeon]|nr:hypothetical protein [Methanomicrobia archaeon]